MGSVEGRGWTSIMKLAAGSQIYRRMRSFWELWLDHAAWKMRQSRNSVKCDSSEELAVSHHTSCNKWALSLVGGGGMLQSEQKTTHYLWSCGAGVGRPTELTIIDE